MDSPVLTELNNFQSYTRDLLTKYALEEVGEAHFQFENNGFTSAFCLKESHICVHTWPEYKQLTLDIYLCNYMQDNKPTVESIAREYISFFKAEIINQYKILR